MNLIAFAMRRPFTNLTLVVALASGATGPKAMDVTVTQRYGCQIRSRRHIEICALESGYLAEISVRDGQTVKKGDLLFKIVAATARAKAVPAKADLDFTNVIAPFDGIVGRLPEQLGSLIKEGDVVTTLSDNSVVWVYFNLPAAQYQEYMASLKQPQEDRKIELVLANGNKFPQNGKISAIAAQVNYDTGNIAFRADFPNPDGLLRHGQTGTILISRKLHDVIEFPPPEEVTRKPKNHADKVVVTRPQVTDVIITQRHIGRIHSQRYTKEGDVPTTSPDNSLMRVYFNVSEKQYLEFMANPKQHEEDKIELVLANRSKFPQPGKIGAIDADFNKETGSIAFRADFPNADGLLRHGQTRIILISRKLHDALVIPPLAVFEKLAKRYVFVVGEHEVVREREIEVQNETDDLFVVTKGLGVNDRIVFQGIQQLRDGEKVEFEFRPLEEVMPKRGENAIARRPGEQYVDRK